MPRWTLRLACLGATLGLICLGFRHNLALGAALAAVFAASLALAPSRRGLLTVLVAAAFGIFGEVVCCYEDLWVYANPSFLKLPCWLPMIWPILMLNFFGLTENLHAFLRGRAFCRRLILPAQLLILAYVLATFAIIQPSISAVYAVFLALIVFFARTPASTLLFLMAAIGGTLGEIICIHRGVWYYTMPHFVAAGIPISLPLAWGSSAVLIRMTVDLAGFREAGSSASGSPSSPPASAGSATGA